MREVVENRLREPGGGERRRESPPPTTRKHSSITTEGCETAQTSKLGRRRIGQQSTLVTVPDARLPHHGRRLACYSSPIMQPGGGYRHWLLWLAVGVACLPRWTSRRSWRSASHARRVLALPQRLAATMFVSRCSRCSTSSFASSWRATSSRCRPRARRSSLSAPTPTSSSTRLW